MGCPYAYPLELDRSAGMEVEKARLGLSLQLQLCKKVALVRTTIYHSLSIPNPSYCTHMQDPPMALQQSGDRKIKNSCSLCFIVTRPERFFVCRPCDPFGYVYDLLSR